MECIQLLAELVCVFVFITFSFGLESNNNASEILNKDKEWILNSSKIMEKLMKDYDPSMAPFVPDCLMDRLTGWHWHKLYCIILTLQEYGLDLYFWQVWNDTRLAQGQERFLSLSGNDIKKVWTPDTYFMNAKKTEIKDVMKDNQMVYIMPNGEVVQMSRITLTVACHMQLQMYPFDRQKCDLVIESFSLTKDKLVYTWGNLIADECRVEVFDDAMAQYEYRGVKLNYRHKKIMSAPFSNLYATWVFDRRTSYTVLQVYLPSYMIVILSFMALWIPQEAVPARVGLGITTVLTIVYFLGTVNNNMPRVSYMKAIDFHLFVSFGFVFATMLEYIIVLNVSAREKRKLESHENYELGPLNNHTSDDSAQNNSYGPNNTEARYRRGSTESHIEDGTLPVLPGQPYRKKSHGVLTTHSVDRFSRILMPAVYATFVVGYWVVCAALSPQREALDLC
ncbi:gamma-aminobutyric acid receptor subunit rho-1-like [Orbicella faveolata]|uniref:gamma-aminobutyric acid receptor subunit rho-1-like n=1 Tax=Orbicella faveolata TaxID=48498 RepID=UPI0009E1CFF0|nr:gamma-aminobutyric acid receptor subunit rho-1-like [Orbicella faveolata]